MAAGGGNGSPWPPFFLEDGAGMEEGLHLTAASLEEENSRSLMTEISRPSSPTTLISPKSISILAVLQY